MTELSKSRDGSPFDEARTWGEGPDGHNDVLKYIDETPDLCALFVELHLMGHVEHGDPESEAWDQIFTITNHWRERELATRSERALPSYEDITGAVARGWCSPLNEHKVMDPELAFAISVQVAALLGLGLPNRQTAQTKGE